MGGFFFVVTGVDWCITSRSVCVKTWPISGCVCVFFKISGASVVVMSRGVFNQQHVEKERGCLTVCGNNAGGFHSAVNRGWCWVVVALRHREQMVTVSTASGSTLKYLILPLIGIKKGLFICFKEPFFEVILSRGFCPSTSVKPEVVRPGRVLLCFLQV